jgi:hypothetical protein
MNHLTSLTAAAQTWASAEVPSESLLSDAELIEGQRVLAEARRAADVRSARFAAEIARRSRPELGHDGLAQRLGARTPQELVQKVAGVGKREASTMVRVGAFLQTPAAPDSPATSSWELAVREATNSGRVSTDVADVIGRALAGLDLDDALLLDAARELLAVAGSVGVDRVAAHARQVRDRLDAAGVASREKALWDARFISFTPQPNGMTRVFGMLDPESAAGFRAVFDAATSPRRGGPRFVDPTDRERERRLIDDPRTVEQIGLDAIIACLEVGMAGETGALLGAQRPAVRVHVTAADLSRGEGAAHLEGQTAAVSVDTARRHACTAGIVPIEFDSDGQVVNIGRSQRLFTARQRIGLAARDGGCRFPDCDRPPGWTEAHHINEWERDHGRTDIADGVLLCRHHHLLVHNNGWRVTRVGADYFVVPPPSIDPRQRPIAAPPKGPGLLASRPSHPSFAGRRVTA